MKSAEQIEQEYLEAYDEYADAIYRHCFFRVYDSARAEELMQETFMKTWQYLSGGKEVENLRAFLYKVANNLVIDYSRKKREDSLERIMEDHPENEPSADPRSEIEKSLLLDQLKDFIKQLEPEVQEIITLRFLDDLEPKEIALILGITPNNASVRINRALRLLQQKAGFNNND